MRPMREQGSYSAAKLTSECRRCGLPPAVRAAGGDRLATDRVAGDQGEHTHSASQDIDDNGDVQILVCIVVSRCCAVVEVGPGCQKEGRAAAGPSVVGDVDRMPEQDSNATGRQALLGSHTSAKRSLAARCSRAADRSKERHGSWSIGVLRNASRHQPTERSIAVRVKPSRNGSGALTRCDADWRR